MTTIYKWKIWCITDSKDEFVWSEVNPERCPTNSSHVIDPEPIIIDQVSQQIMKIKEETIQTGGNFGCSTVKIICDPNTTTFKQIWWDIPISVLNVNVISKEENRNDILNISVGKNTIIGAITSAITSATTWVVQNYIIGDKVIYDHPSYGSRTYTCITDTINAELPTNLIYWRRGYEIPVNNTVIDNSFIGVYLAITDGIDTNNLGQLISKTANSIYVTESPLINFSSGYIMQSIYMIKDYIFDEPWNVDISSKKIGGTYIPQDTIVTLEYTNNTTASKTMVGKYEFLY